MDWRAAAVHLVAVLLYPGAALTLALGTAAHLAGSWRSGGRDLALWRAPAGAASALLATLAATQLSIPFSPLDGDERNLAIAALALCGAGWAGWTAAGAGLEAGRALLAAQGGWLLALLLPAVVEQSLRPQTLAAVVVTPFLPLKVSAAVLYLLCLPILAGRLRDLAGALCWFPACGLGVSVFLPPLPASGPGLAGFAAATLLVGGAAWLLGRLAPAVLLRAALPVAVAALAATAFAAAMR